MKVIAAYLQSLNLQHKVLAFLLIVWVLECLLKIRESVNDSKTSLDRSSFGNNVDTKCFLSTRLDQVSLSS